jgi:hypothetical protein
MSGERHMEVVDRKAGKNASEDRNNGGRRQ